MLSITSPLVTSWSLPPTPITTEAITTAITLATCATEAFGQCAGRGMASEECCPAEYKCVEQTKFYSSCLPKYSPPSPPPAPPPVPAGQCPTLKYAQCDGDGIATTLCCPAEFKCAKIAKEGVSFSQCIPEHVPPPSPSPPPSPPPVPAGQCVTLKYGQCAGRGMTSEACCPAEFKCVAQTKFFSQCLPKRSPPSPPPSPPPVPAGQCPTLKYSQCGGEGIASTLCCPTGSSCVEKTPFFSQCLPPTPLTTAPTLATCATEAFGQCAGRGMASEECCPAEYKCVEQTKFYSSCLPKYSPPSPPPAPPPVPAGQCPTLKYAQCDGDGIATTLCCPAEFKCAKIAKEGVSFSQCIPEHVPPPSPSPPPSPPPVPAGQCVTLKYGQCAGRGMTSEACCPAEFKCVAQTKFFSQCLPKRSPPSPPPSPPPVPAGQCPTLKYSQCGGEGIASTLCCPTGSSCVEKTPFFSQCLPPTCMGGELSVCVARCAETAATYQKCVETCLAHC